MYVYLCSRVIIFGSIDFYKKKVTKSISFKKTKTGSNQPVSVRFGLFLGQKPVQIGLVRFFRFGLVLARFFPVWVRFFRFQAYKTETEP